MAVAPGGRPSVQPPPLVSAVTMPISPALCSAAPHAAEPHRDWTASVDSLYPARTRRPQMVCHRSAQETLKCNAVPKMVSQAGKNCASLL